MNATIDHLSETFIAERAAAEYTGVCASAQSNSLPSQCAGLTRSALIPMLLSESSVICGNNELAALFPIRTVCELDDAQWRNKDLSAITDAQLEAALSLCKICEGVQSPELTTAFSLFLDPKVISSLRATHAAREFRSISVDTERILERLLTAGNEILSSDALVTLMKAFLEAGNALNCRSHVHAFKLSSLRSALSMRSPVTRASLVNEVSSALGHLQMPDWLVHGKPLPELWMVEIGRLRRLAKVVHHHHLEHGDANHEADGVRDAMTRLDARFREVRSLIRRVAAYLQEADAERML